jgi:hypothetical protein
MVGALLPPAPALAGGRSFQVRGTDVIAREAAGDRPLWQRSFPQLVLSQPLVIGDAVVVRVGTGDLVALDAASGAERWRSATRVTAYSGGERTFLAARADRLVVPYPEKLIGYGAGPDTPGVDPDPWRAPSAVSLEMELPRGTRRRIFGRPHEVHGRFERNEGQEEHRVVELQADPWPFDGAWQTVQTMASDTISTTHRPDRNTRLRLHYGGVDPAKVTEPVTSWVELAIGVRYRSLSRTRLRARTTLRGPADALARPTTMHFYFFRAATGRATRLRSVRLRRSGDALRGTVVLRVPRRFGRRDSVFPAIARRRPTRGASRCARCATADARGSRRRGARR